MRRTFAVNNEYVHYANITLYMYAVLIRRTNTPYLCAVPIPRTLTRSTYTLYLYAIKKASGANQTRGGPGGEVTHSLRQREFLQLQCFFLGVESS